MGLNKPPWFNCKQTKIAIVDVVVVNIVLVMHSFKFIVYPDFSTINALT